MFGKLVTILLIVFSANCFGDVKNVEVSVLVGAYHFEKADRVTGDRRSNEVYGLGANVDGYELLVFRNSYERLSIALGHRWSYTPVRFVTAAVTLGFVTGYARGNISRSGGLYGDSDAHDGEKDLLPFVLPSLRFNLGNYNIAASYFISGVAFSVGRKF